MPLYYRGASSFLTLAAHQGFPDERKMSPARAKVWTGAQWSERIAPLVDFPDDGPPPWLLPGGLPGDVREQDVPSLRQGAVWSSMERQD